MGSMFEVPSFAALLQAKHPANNRKKQVKKTFLFTAQK